MAHMRKKTDAYRLRCWNMKKRHHLKDLGINGRKILKHRINPAQGRGKWRRLLKRYTVYLFLKIREFIEYLLASQEELH